ncbi:type IV pilus modification protein PilV [Propionivibrio sp.]|uniref:type IV pilus modification protein PilV n=1 Tax=Propionivibrio sp. TaxID=2212460 RepID=UPI0039E3223C
MSRNKVQHGFSLIEILVSIVIICFGLLGVAGLLTNGLKNTQSSQYRTQASFLAYDLAERMRVNRQIALNGEYSTSVTATNSIAANDKLEWQAAVGTLPAGVGTVAMTNTTFFTITIQWDDSKAAGGGATEQFVFRGEL